MAKSIRASAVKGSAGSERPKRAAKPKRLSIELSGGTLLEPDWCGLLPNTNEQAAAREHWNRIAEEMRDREELSLSNGHALQRLVLAYIVYNRCSMMVAVDGLVTEPKANNPKAIPRLSIHYHAMQEAEKTSERLEKQLGLSPDRRGKAGKVTKRRERSAGADRYRSPA